MATLGDIILVELTQGTCGPANLNVNVTVTMQFPYVGTVNVCNADIKKGTTTVWSGALPDASGTHPIYVRSKTNIPISRALYGVNNGDILKAEVSAAWTLQVPENDSDSSGTITVSGCS